MDKQNNSNLDALLNNLIENFGEDDPVTQKVESLMEENVNLLLVGATGSGKSSTINAMFNMQVAKVGVGVDPETACIEKYELGGLTIWDTPGLGDGVERDIEIATAIKAKVAHKNGLSAKFFAEQHPDVVIHVLYECLFRAPPQLPLVLGILAFMGTYRHSRHKRISQQYSIKWSFCFSYGNCHSVRNECHALLWSLGSSFVYCRHIVCRYIFH